MQNKINLKELSEQIQNDLIALLDGQSEELIDQVCQVVVNNVNSKIGQPAPDWDDLYNFVDEQSIGGCTIAQKIIEEHGYVTPYGVLYDYVDNCRIEGNDGAIKLLNTIK